MKVAVFRPAGWLPGPHLQTLGGRLLRPLDSVPLRRARIELPDGDFVDLHEGPDELPADAPIALVLHGLEGSARSNYVASMARELARCGIRAIRLNLRGCSVEMNRLARFYHAGDTADLGFVIRRLRTRCPDAPLTAIGFSLGGNVLLKYLGERGPDAGSDLMAAAVVSVPFDLAAGTRRLEEAWMSRTYMLHFVRKLRAKASSKRALLADICDVDRAIGARTIREFDDLVTAPLHGFRDAWHYYETCSSNRWLSKIRVPTLVLHSLDDPFLPAGVVPRDAIRINPFLVDGVTPVGGHVGFVTGTPWNPIFWAEREAARFVADASWAAMANAPAPASSRESA